MSQGQHHWGTHSQNRDYSVEERREKSISSDRASWNLLLHSSSQFPARVNPTLLRLDCSVCGVYAAWTLAEMAHR